MLKLQVLSCAVALAIAAPAAADKTISVDCGSRTISDVLADKGDKDKPLVLQVRGNCSESVTINRDDVTLEGDPAGATINGSVTIDNARRVVVSNLTVTNASADGITVINGASATIRRSQVVLNGGYGIMVRNGSFAIVERNVLSNNGRTNPQASGINVAVGSTARGLENVMEGNPNAAIEVGDSSNYRSEGDTASSGPSGRVALDIYRAGFVDVRRVTATGNIDLNQQSQLQVRNVDGFPASTITGNINAGGLSYLRLRSGVIHAGSRTCGVGTGFFTVPATFLICQVDP